MQKEEVLEKLRRYCSYQDRCHQEVRSYLISKKVYGELLEEIIHDLVQEGYLNEERFAQSFARGKHRIKYWGKFKIQQELKRRNLSEYCIKKGLEAIDEEEYIFNLRRLVQNYIGARIKRYERKELYRKTFSYLRNKGYEADVTSGLIEEYLKLLM